ncbi:hypothetical protein [Acinetobacter nectaris]|uniref:hypothetical protein n=1 Tax=Acinetobacter nectaris TaxID=1219382 RepID=UPI001F365AB2|nr:hypothetical protein [Acinetobacter nectaris]MCF9034187.1 hypothetical protein [Acinetobacter nectaris]
MKTRSLQLDDTWDMQLNSVGDWATTTQSDAVVQDVSCACMTLKGEVLFDGDLGIPFFEKILGRTPSLQLLSHHLKTQALKLSTVRNVSVQLNPDKKTRSTTGYLEITDNNNQTSTVEI